LSQAVIAALSAVRFRWTGEKDLQDGIESVLVGAGLEFRREHRLSGADVIDFLVGSTGVEVKIKGQAAAVLAQLTRYAEHESVTELVLVTGRLQLTRMPGMLNGKPLRVIPLTGSLLG
jgi:hypothetical protein